MAQEAKPGAQRSTERSSDSPPSIYDSPSKAKKLRSVFSVTSVNSDKKTQKTLEKLSDTVRGLSAMLVVPDLKVKHLSESMNDEKKRRKRKRKVTEELRASGHSGALFMSPSKIQKTGDIALSREREKRQLLQNKELRAQERAQKKVQKELEAQRSEMNDLQLLLLARQLLLRRRLLLRGHKRLGRPKNRSNLNPWLRAGSPEAVRGNS